MVDGHQSAVEGETLLSQDYPVPSLEDALRLVGQSQVNMAMARRTVDMLKGEDEDAELDRLHDELLGCIVRLQHVGSTLWARYYGEQGQMNMTERAGVV